MRAKVYHLWKIIIRMLKANLSSLNTGLCQKRQLQTQLLTSESWERLGPPVSPGLCRPNPNLLGHLKPNTSKADLIPHLSVDSMDEYMNEWSGTPTKNRVFIYSNRAHTHLLQIKPSPTPNPIPPSLGCKLIFLSDLRLHDTHSQSHASPPSLHLFQEILWVLILKLELPVEMKVCGGDLRALRPPGRCWGHFFKALVLGPWQYNWVNQRQPFRPRCLVGSSSLIIQHFYSLKNSFLGTDLPARQKAAILQ